MGVTGSVELNFIQYEIARVRAKPERRAIVIGLNEGRLNQSPIPARPSPQIICFSVSIIIHINLNLEANSQVGTSAGDVLNKEDPGDPRSKLMETQAHKQSQKPGRRAGRTSRIIAVAICVYFMLLFEERYKSKFGLRLLPRYSPGRRLEITMFC